MAEFTINLDDKPNLSKLMKANPQAARMLIGAFVQAMEEGAEQRWDKLDKAFHPSLPFPKLVNDVLHALLDVHEIDPEFYPDLQIYSHPLGLLSYKMPDGTGMRFFDWQRHFDTYGGVDPDVRKILRKYLYYMRYIQVEEFYKALLNDRMNLYMAERPQDALIPIQPALRYQQDHIGDMQVGKMREDVGFFDCGELKDADIQGEHVCPACHALSSQLVVDTEHYRLCMKCGASFALDNP